MGELSHFDEFLGLDRTLGFARNDDWLTVYTAGEPTLRKPPMQYWMSAGLMGLGLDDLVAMRLPSMIFALGVLMSVILLALAILPERPWVGAASVVVFASSTEFWRYALSAMLDTGATFFLTLGFAAALLARRNSRWWVLAGLAAVLGSLHKAPLVFVFLALYLVLLRRTSGDAATGLHWLRTNDPVFRRTLRISIAAALAWPVLQIALNGPGLFIDAYGAQMIERFAPIAPVKDPRSVAQLIGLLVGREPLLRSLGIAALVALPFVLKRRDLLPLPLCFAVYAVAMFLAGGNVYPRYALLFDPLMAVALGAVVCLPRAPWLGGLAALGISALASGPVKSPGQLALGAKEATRSAVAALKRAGAIVTPDDTFVLCNWHPKTRISNGAVSVYASGGRAYTDLLKIPDIMAEGQRLAGRRVLGVCPQADMAELSVVFDGMIIRETNSGFAIWSAESLALR